MIQARYPLEQLKMLDEARFCQKTDAINRRLNAVYFHGLGHTQRQRRSWPTSVPTRCGSSWPPSSPGDWRR